MFFHLQLKLFIKLLNNIFELKISDTKLQQNFTLLNIKCDVPCSKVFIIIVCVYSGESIYDHLREKHF